jgi:hypothetical protein
MESPRPTKNQKSPLMVSEYFMASPWNYQFTEEVVFCGLLKNAQMQGSRNPEE